MTNEYDPITAPERWHRNADQVRDWDRQRLQRHYARACEQRSDGGRRSAEARISRADARREAIRRELLADSTREPSAGEVARRLAALHSDDCPDGCAHVNPKGEPWSERTIRGDLAALHAKNPASS